MGKKQKSRFKKGNVSKSNRPANPKSLEIKQIQKNHRIAASDTAKKEVKSIVEKSVLEDGKKPMSWKVLGFFFSLIVLTIGFLGYDALWPKVVIDSSPAVDSGIISYQFMFENQPCYPVKIISVTVSAIDLSMPHLTGYGGLNVSGITIKQLYDDRDAKIGGRDSVTLKLADMFVKMPNLGKVNEGSKMIIRITYRLPLPFLKIEKTDSQFFEAGEDTDKNPVWMKKPMGQFSNYKDGATFYYTGTNVVY